MRNVSRSFRWFPAAVALAVVSVGISTQPRRAMADPLLDAPFTTPPSDCTYYCRPCGGRDGFHEIIWSVNSNASSSHLENCSAGQCGWHNCEIDHVLVSTMSEMWFAARGEDDERLRELLQENREVAYVNPERHAVQVKGCNGDVLASIPLSDEQVALLEE
jgi:hypothetical protein